MRDQAYVYQTLGFHYEFWKFYHDLFRITKEVADTVWQDKKEWFNTFDYIVTSDTAPLSRIFMEHVDELKPKVVVWICNRFDYNMEWDKSFYTIFNKVVTENPETFKVVPYSEFEKAWCQLRGITAPLCNVITPIGENPIELDDHIDCLQQFKDKYIKDSNSKEQFTDAKELEGKMFIPIYGNDNHFFKLKSIFEINDIPCYNGGYNHSVDLKYCKALVTFPEQFSKLITFETIQNEIVVFLPSPSFLIKLHPTMQHGYRYWFNSPVGNLDNNLISFCEWYRFENCRIYVDSIEDLIYKIKHLTPELVEEKRKWCRIYGEQIKRENLAKWANIFTS